MKPRLGVVPAAFLLLASFCPWASAATFTVTNTNDSGAGSLRQAILSANLTVAADLIRFSIPGNGVHTISPTSPLPVITSPVTVDGGTQQIELNGSGAGNGTDGLTITAGDSTIRSLTINRFRPVAFGGGGNGIVLDTGGGNSVFNCQIGTNPAGTAILGNGGSGISISNSSGNHIGDLATPAPQRNVISGNSVGVFIFGSGSNDNTVKGNRIGTNAGGTAGLGNTGDGVIVLAGTGNQILQNVISGNDGNGVLVSTAATATLVASNLVGTTLSGGTILGNGTDGIQVNQCSDNTVQGNSVAGNGRNGILVFNLADGNFVVGNFVGTNASGASGLGNAGNGINVSGSSDNMIGGTTPADRNVVCDNGTNGIRVRSDAAGNTVRGNFVGVAPDGVTLIGNLADGIQLNDAAKNNTIGGTVPGAGNVISGNAVNGVRLADATTTSNLVQGNRIGTDVAGADSLGNAGNGVLIENGAVGNTVGGEGPGAGNTIAFNGGAGILVDSGTNDALLGNAIHSNGGLGIDLAPSGVTPNDPTDADGGPNNLQNFPVLIGATAPAGTTVIQGTLSSAGGATYRIEVFASPSCDGSGNGEGARFLGSQDVATDGLGAASFGITLPVPATLGSLITTTATDAAGNTSEFSNCVPISAGFYSVPPCRVADTRAAAGPLGGPALLAGASRTFPALSACGLTSTARALAVNVTVIGATAAGHLTLFAGGESAPFTSTLNYAPGQTRANNAIVALGPSGDLTVFCGQASGTVNVIIDVTGYFE